jgi:hypothetical protein
MNPQHEALKTQCVLVSAPVQTMCDIPQSLAGNLPFWVHAPHKQKNEILKNQKNGKR